MARIKLSDFYVFCVIHISDKCPESTEGDMGDEALHLAASFFALIGEQAPKQRYSLREVFVGWAAIRKLCHADAVQSRLALGFRS